MKSPPIISTAVCLAALLAAAALVPALSALPSLVRPPNPFALGGSPYGKTFGIIIQAPIDEIWHGLEGDEHDHGHANCDTCQVRAASGPISQLAEATHIRTNPAPISTAHTLHLRREIENQLTFAWWLDPANHANYNGLHLFLTSSVISGLEFNERLEKALEIADRTFTSIPADALSPEIWITAASSQINTLSILDALRQRGQDVNARYAAALERLDTAIQNFSRTRAEAVTSGRWDSLSPTRREIIDERGAELPPFLDAHRTIHQRHLPPAQ